MHSTGTGVIMADAVATAYHVIECPKGKNLTGVVIKDKQGNTYFGLPTRVNEDRDVAFLGITPESKMQVPEIAKPKVGDRVCYHAFIPRIETLCGTITEHEELLYKVDAPAISGNSGSGVYNERGELIGLVVRKVTRDGTSVGMKFTPAIAE